MLGGSSSSGDRWWCELHSRRPAANETVLLLLLLEEEEVCLRAPVRRQMASRFAFHAAEKLCRNGVAVRCSARRTACYIVVDSAGGGGGSQATATGGGHNAPSTDLYRTPVPVCSAITRAAFSCHSSVRYRRVHAPSTLSLSLSLCTSITARPRVCVCVCFVRYTRSCSARAF